MAKPTAASSSISRIRPTFRTMDHFIVVGSDSLAHRLVVELTEQYEVPVVVIVPDTEHDHAPQIVKMLGENAVVSASVVGDEALHAAGVGRARGIALLSGDDQDKLSSALRAQAINVGIRIVLAMDSTRLGANVERLLQNCAVLSSAATAAPAFVNAALRRPSSVRVGGRSLAIDVRDDADQSDYLAVVADEIDSADSPRSRLLPDSPSPAALWIGAVSRRGPRDGRLAVLDFVQDQQNALTGGFARWWRRAVALWSILSLLRMKILLGLAAFVIVAAIVVTWALNRPFSWALYQTILGLAHIDVPGATGGAWQRTVQVALALDSFLIAALVTASLVGTLRQRDAPGRPNPRIRGHVVVVGLDNLGMHIALLLHELDVPVVCIERDSAAPGVAVAREVDIPVLTGTGRISSLLREARVQHSRAVMAVSGNDAANLEAALEARALAPDVRAVLRLFDDELAAQVYRTMANTASRSASYLAAPAFAAALMGRAVLGTLTVYRHVVMIGVFTVHAGTDLVGRPLRDIEIPGELRVIAVRSQDTGEYIWRPDHGGLLVAGDEYVILATRTGMARHIEWTTSDPYFRTGDEYRPDRDIPEQRTAPVTDEFIVAVYQTDVAFGESMKAAVLEYLDAIGAQITEDNDPVIGSWSWFAKARRIGKAAADSEAAHQAGNLAESLAWGPVRSRQADINLVNSQAVANLVQALADSSNGLILVGSLLVIKTGNVPIVVMLSQEQVNTLERRPALLRQPETILDDLQRVRAEDVDDLDPPGLTG